MLMLAFCCLEEQLESLGNDTKFLFGCKLIGFQSVRRLKTISNVNFLNSELNF